MILLALSGLPSVLPSTSLFDRWWNTAVGDAAGRNIDHSETAALVDHMTVGVVGIGETSVREGEGLGEGWNDSDLIRSSASRVSTKVSTPSTSVAGCIAVGIMVEWRLVPTMPMYSRTSKGCSSAVSRCCYLRCRPTRHRSRSHTQRQPPRTASC